MATENAPVDAVTETAPEANVEVVENTAGETENTEVQTEATVEVETATVERVKRVRIKSEVFMRVWEETVAGLEDGDLEGSGIKIVAERLGLGINTVQQRSTKYRKTLGLPLSNMPRGGGAKFNVTTATDELAAIKEAIAKARLEKTEAAAPQEGENVETPDAEG